LGSSNQPTTSPGIAASRLFWTIRIPDDALTIRSQTAQLELKDVPVIDSHVFGGAVPFLRRSASI
jgi:hypothetical protein